MRLGTTMTAVFGLIFVAGAIQLGAQAPVEGGTGGRGSAITTGYPSRPPADPAVVERGRLLYSTNCAFCHGPDARGGEGGTNLLRSEIVLNDKSGELIGDILRNGLSAMPKFELNASQVGGRNLTVNEARPKPQRGGGFGGDDSRRRRRSEPRW